MSATDANTPQQKDQLPDILYVALLVTERLATLGIRYLIGGSMASIIHGLPRLTQNIDLVAEIKEPHIPALVQAFAEEFYVDEQAIQRAIRQHSGFNLIFLATMYKVDVFLPKNDAWAQEYFDRCLQLPLLPGEASSVRNLASAETIVLQKLLWFKKGGSVSEKQWNDILGVLKVQGGRLDEAYLRQWASTLGVSELLNRAISETTPKTS